MWYWGLSFSLETQETNGTLNASGERREYKSIFYQQLVRALLHDGFQLQSGDFSQDGLTQTRRAAFSDKKSDRINRTDLPYFRS